MRTDLTQSCVVLLTERRGCVEEQRDTHEVAAHAVAADGRRQPELLLNLRGPPPTSPWSSVEAESSTAQAKVACHRGGPPPLPSTPSAAVADTNRSPVCYLSQEREISRVRSLLVVVGAGRGHIDLWAIFDRAFVPFVR
jgi:hypothetical protein